MKKEDKDKHCHYSGLPSPSAYAKDDIDYDGMGNQGRVPSKDKKMRHREEIVLMWIILVITGLGAIVYYPPILLVGIVLYASITLYNHYRYNK
tara:strand:- start:754 stop:1032 length:279 start_codon:yes stop_codon:yes gene_type:complete